jgi:hypothetical protein
MENRQIFDACSENLDRSRRANNPEVFHENGSIKPGAKLKKTKGYKRVQRQLVTKKEKESFKAYCTWKFGQQNFDHGKQNLYGKAIRIGKKDYLEKA